MCFSYQNVTSHWLDKWVRHYSRYHLRDLKENKAVYTGMSL